jgi:iron complex transport system permease protein
VSTSTVAPRRPSSSGPVAPSAEGAAARKGLVRTRTLRVTGLFVCLGTLFLICLASIIYGSKPLSFSTVVDAFTDFNPDSTDHLIVRELRLPRTIVGLLVGAALGLAGAILQGLARNPLADPSILGLNAGASLFVVLGIFVFGVGSLSGYVWFAFAGTALAGIVVWTLASAGRGGATPVKLALAGAAITAVITSVTWGILLADVATFDQFRFWQVGSISGRDAEIAWQVAPFLLVGAVMAMASGRLLNALSLGDDVARSLGTRLGVARGFSGAAVVLLIGGATAAAGPVAFVGLIIPHIARAITGPDYRWVLPYSALLAPILLLGSDVIGRLVVRPGELQVGIVTAVIGAPFFVALVRRRKLAEL